MLEMVRTTKRSAKLIDRNDDDRTLVTETIPFETPIIFSNEGLYERIKRNPSPCLFEDYLTKAIVYGDNSKLFGQNNTNKPKATEPFLYKIKKSQREYRRLALPHPASQWKMRNFYKEHHDRILHFCSISPATIRSPKSVASRFYTRGPLENIYQYKEPGNVSSELEDKQTRHAPSYFSYKGYDRLYKFFNSPEYFSLEKNFSVYMSLDVSKCFDSIYTHAISWATKEKEFSKNHLQSTTFGSIFDETIRHGNHNETNGIPIGPEASRIFSEIIFQKIDVLAIDEMTRSGFRFTIDYTIKRYVDDVNIFAKNQDIAEKVHAVYSDTLLKFNLHVNASKTSTQTRPFASKKSRLIYRTSKRANEFFNSLLRTDDQGALVPSNNHSAWLSVKDFIDSIKNLCSEENVGYDEVSSFLIASATERVKRIFPPNTNAPPDSEIVYSNAAHVILEITFFLYSVSPSVSASYKLSTAIILILRFFRRCITTQEEVIAHKIYHLISELLLCGSDRHDTSHIQNFVNLESINILLASRELGESYLIPEEPLSKILLNNKTFSYFSASACLYYIRNSDQYPSIKKKLYKYLRLQFSSMKDVFTSSEKAHLYLDMIGCPYICSSDKEQWISEMADILIPNRTPINSKKAAVELETQKWHVNWQDTDLLNLLEKKELKQSY